MAAPKKITKETVKAVKAEPVKTEEVKAESVKAELDKAADKAQVKEVKKPEAEAAAAKKPEVKKTTIRKAAAKKAELKSAVHVQFDGKSYSQEDLLKMAKDVWKYDLKQKARDLSSVELYVKPEENLVYYVMNKEFMGSFQI